MTVNDPTAPGMVTPPDQNGAAGEGEPAGDGIKTPTNPTESMPLRITIRGPRENELTFDVKSNKTLAKMMSVYTERMGYKPREIRFLFDGERLEGTRTPLEYEMESGDIIEAHLEQIGGNSVVPSIELPLLQKQKSTMGIKVVNPTGESQTFFRVGSTTPLTKMMETYSRRVGMSTLRFVVDGKQVVGRMTPEELEMEDNDTIQTFIEAIGGDGSHPSGTPPPTADADANGEEAAPVAPQGEMISITVRGPGNNEATFKLKKNTNLGKLMKRYTADRGVERSEYRFLSDGRRVMDGQTPEQLEIEDGDLIDVFTQQIGGGGERKRLKQEPDESSQVKPEAQVKEEISATTVAVKHEQIAAVLDQPTPGGIHLQIRFRGPATIRQFYRILPSAKLGKYMEFYADQIGYEYIEQVAYDGEAQPRLRFTLNGQRVKPDQTASELRMEDGDTIDVAAIRADIVDIRPPQTEPDIQIFLRTGGKTHSFKCKGSFSVLRIKEALQIITGAPVSEQRLSFGGAGLRNDDLLSDHRIRDGSEMSMTLLLRGS